MKAPAVVSLAVLCSLAAAALVHLLAGAGAEPAVAGHGALPDGRVDRVLDRLERLAQEVAELRQRVAEAESASARQPAAATVTRDDVEAAVAAALARQRAAGAGADTPADMAAEDPPITLAEAIEELGSAKGQRYFEVWERVREAGLEAEVLARLEAAVESRPGDAEAHNDLGTAYIAQLQNEPNEMRKGTLAMLADKSFDTALELDPRHWEARFTKAVSLSFWPPLMGKQGEAIAHFERLIELQHEAGNDRPEHASSYFYLGNLHAQRGDEAKAREIWQQGLTLFPASRELRERLGR